MALLNITVRVEINHEVDGKPLTSQELVDMLNADNTAKSFHIGGKLLDGITNQLLDEFNVDITDADTGFDDVEVKAIKA